MRSTNRAGVTIDQMMLLISAARLHHRFRFAKNVTNLQQAAAAAKAEAITAKYLQRLFSARIGRHTACRRLEQGLALFRHLRDA
jgi:hypothetical protein